MNTSPPSFRNRSSDSDRRMLQSTREAGKRVLTGVVHPPKMIVTVDGQRRPAQKRKKKEVAGTPKTPRSKKARAATEDDAYAAMVLGVASASASAAVSVATTTPAAPPRYKFVPAPKTTTPVESPCKCIHGRPLFDCQPCHQAALEENSHYNVESSFI